MGEEGVFIPKGCCVTVWVGINETKVENADMGKDKEGEAISSGGEGGVSASFGQFHVDPEDGIDERSLNART